MDVIYSCLMSHEPVDLLVIMLGTNDTKERFSASAQCIALGLKQLVDKAAATRDCWAGGKVNILIVTPQNIDPKYQGTDSKMGSEKQVVRPLSPSSRIR